MWYIGQDIVCIKTHSKGLIKEGDVFTIKGLNELCCIIIIDVGIPTQNNLTRCPCGNISAKDDNIFWFGESLFTPLDELSDITEILEHLENTVTV